MAVSGLNEFIHLLESNNEVQRISTFVDPVLEITEVSDRIVKNNGKALLFENNGTSFPLLINAFGSGRRIGLALHGSEPEDIAAEIMRLFDNMAGKRKSLLEKIFSLPELLRLSGYFPVHVRGAGLCQQLIHKDPDLNMLPVLWCWPHDAGRFITLPVVHTIHPISGASNAGMYRMQVLDRNTTAMHWQLHKTGANHFTAWKNEGKRMPVTVTLGGDPVYTYSSTAPLPENIDEYILAGFLRKRKVKLVKCITNDLWIPSDADIVLEGFVDTSEEPVIEGPFGDHTGFYSLAGLYPRFHVTCITHARKAVYPATVVGIPPHEDAWLTKATEKIFLAPMKLAIQPEIVDFHMPEAGVAHNLVIVKINKSYQGQGKKVISSLFGAGQMMFTKYLLVVSGETDIRDYRRLLKHIFENTDFRKDLMFSSGPLDVLDHASDTYSLGGKLGIDSTIKLDEELSGSDTARTLTMSNDTDSVLSVLERSVETGEKINLLPGMPVIVTALNLAENPMAVTISKQAFRALLPDGIPWLILAVDDTVDVTDLFMVAWQASGNTDPKRDIDFISDDILFADATIKAFRPGGFPRRWPNVVCSSVETIRSVDIKWESLGLGPYLNSPSERYSRLIRKGSDEVIGLPDN